MGPAFSEEGFSASAASADGDASIGASAFLARKEEARQVLEDGYLCFMGPGFLARTVEQRGKSAESQSASMGPRLFSRGRHGGSGLDAPADGASMGPRLFSRGRFAPRNLFAAFGLPRRFRGVAHGGQPYGACFLVLSATIVMPMGCGCERSRAFFHHRTPRTAKDSRPRPR